MKLTRARVLAALAIIVLVSAGVPVPNDAQKDIAQGDDVTQPVNYSLPTDEGLLELAPENTVILSSETDASFCRDFSALLNRVRPEWIVLEDTEIPESVRDANLIIIGTLDSEYTGEIIKALLTQEEKAYIRDGHHAVYERESPWRENRVIYVCTGSDGILTKQAAEEAIASLGDEWTFPPFSSVPREEALATIAQLQYIPADDELPMEALRMEIDPKAPKHISPEEAAEDVERLFYLFSYGYCGYGYFVSRGDFDKAKQATLSKLETQSTWSLEDLSQLLYDNLSFIHDCHLKIGAHKYGNHQDFWYDTRLELWKTAGEYYFSSEDVTYKVVSIDGEDPEAFIFPSLNAQGDPIYRIGTLSSSVPEPLPLTAYRDEQRQFTIQLYRSDFDYFSDEIFQEDTIGGIPVVRIRSFSDHHGGHLNQFLETAYKYRGAPFLIVDIRGNGGGNEEWPRRWITRFTGQQPSSKRYFAELISKTTMMGRANNFERLLDFYPETDEYKLERDQYLAQAEAFERHAAVPHWTGPFSAPVQAISNETTVIVVMNGKVGSAGEGFINYISQVENVLFVGENSWGALVFGQVSYHRLAHSTLLVQMPISLNIPLNLELREERGFFPHLWVPGEDALNYAVAAARRGTITSHKTLPEGYFDGAFVPEKSFRNSWIYLPREQLLWSVGLIVFGLVCSLRLRKQTSFFIVFGTSVIVQAVVLIIKDRSFGYLLVLYGMVFLAVGIFRWRRNKIALEKNPTR